VVFIGQQIKFYMDDQTKKSIGLIKKVARDDELDATVVIGTNPESEIKK
jgi:hypothetical protein